MVQVTVTSRKVKHPLSVRTSARLPKSQQVCLRLREMAHRLGPGAKFPTVQELRQEMNVSLDTLNAALREAEEQSILTRRHSVGIFVSELLQKNIALICNPASFRSADHSPFWDLLLDNVLEPTRGSLRVTCHFASPTPDALLPPALMGEIASGRVDGVLAVTIGDEAAQWIMAQKVPLVHLFGPGHVIIMPDEDEMMRQAATVLSAQGCCRIGLWQGMPPGGVSHYWHKRQARRQEIFAQALRDQGREFDQTLMENGVAGDPTSLPEQGFAMARRVFGNPSALRPDGVFISDDTMTRGVLTALQKEGIVVGKDIRIASHSNRRSPVLLGHEDELTRVEYDPAEFVSAMFFHLNALTSISALPLEELVLIKPRVCIGHADA